MPRGASADQAASLAERLQRRTLELIDIPSESGDESGILSHLGGLLETAWLRPVERGDGVLSTLPHRRTGVPLVLLAGHVDTVPIAGAAAGRIEDGHVTGRGAADMKGAVAVIVELVRDLAEPPTGLDLGVVLFGREELPAPHGVLAPMLERSAALRAADLAIVMEPTDNAAEVGCLGNLNARVRVRGTAGHTARPWLAENAIHAAIQILSPLAELAPVDVEIDGLVYREVASVTSIRGGASTNVVPDVVEADVNLRYAPNVAPGDAEARLGSLLGDPRAEIEILGNSPPAPVVASHPLVRRLRAAGDLPVGPKQAWTPVADFAAAGVAAINFGPGDPRYAHRDDERVGAEALVRSYDVLHAFLTGTRAMGA